jgi:hypothetical protein
VKTFFQEWTSTGYPIGFAESWRAWSVMLCAKLSLRSAERANSRPVP